MDGAFSVADAQSWITVVQCDDMPGDQIWKFASITVEIVL